MNRVVQKYNKFDIAIFTAAVSDISPIKTTNKKIKKNQLKNIILKNNPDIIKNFSKKTFKNIKTKNTLKYRMQKKYTIFFEKIQKSSHNLYKYHYR